MSGECDVCGDHTLECLCLENDRLEIAMSALQFSMNTLSMLGYELIGKIEFKKVPKSLQRKIS